MKKIVLSSILFLSGTTFANPLVVCKLSSMQISIQSSNADKLRAEFKAKSGQIQKTPVLEMIDLSRADVNQDEFLNQVRIKARLNPIGYISARIYITDSNSEGKTGLMTFKGAGSGSAKSGGIATAYISTANGMIEICK